MNYQKYLKGYFDGIPKAQQGIWATASLPSAGISSGSTSVSDQEIYRISQINKLAKEIMKKDPKNYTQKDLDILDQSTIKESKKYLDQYKIQKANKARKKGWSNPKEFAEATSAVGSKLSLQNIPVIGEYIPDELDVTRNIGNMAEGIGAVPYNIQQGNYAKAAADVAIPLATGALGGIGASNTGQFVNNIINPLAGAKDLLLESKNLISNTATKVIGENYAGAPSYIKDLTYNIPKGQLPKYKNAVRWQPDVVPEQLVESGKTLTPEQQQLTGSWYGYNPAEVETGSYLNGLGFYPDTRPGPGTIKVVRLSNRQIDELEKSMPASAKGMSGKVNSAKESDTHLKGELVLPEKLRSNPNLSIGFSENPAEYLFSNQSDDVILAPWQRRAATGQYINDIINSQYSPILNVPREYFPFEDGGQPVYILNKNNTLMNRNYNFQDGGLLGSLAGKISSTMNANTMGNTFGAFGGAGQKYKELLGGTGLEPKPLLDWATAEPQYRSKITKDLKWDRENQGWMDANGNSVSNEEITTKARELYDQDKQRNQTITEGLPMSTQFGALFALNQAEQDEMANKKSSLSDYPAVKSTYAPSGFEQGGQANDYNNLLSLFSDGGGTQQGGRVQQMMGYKEGSPYANEPYQTFNTDTITMDGVNRQILGIPNVGNPVLMQPNSGLYRFNNADYVTEVPMSRNGGMYIDGIEQAQFGKFLKGVGRTLHDYGRGKLDFIGNTTGLFDLSNEKYKTKFGKKFSGAADKWARGVGTIGRAVANVALPGSGTALSMLGKAINPNGLGNKGQQSMGADTSQMGSSQQNPLAGLGLLFGNNPGGMGGAGGGLGSLLGGLGGSGGGGLGALLGGSGGGGLGALLGFGEDGGKVQYNKLNNLFQDGGQTQPMPPQAQPQQEQMEAPQQESKLMQLPIEQQVELYKGLVDFVAQNGIDALEEQYPEEYEFFEAFSDFLEDSEDADGEEEDNQMPERMANGGIPQRYKNMGFSKVGQKKSSDRPGKKWKVLAKKGDKYKVVHGGAKGMSDFTKHRNEKRRQRFWDRMGGTQSAKAKDPFSPLYWHKRFGTW